MTAPAHGLGWPGQPDQGGASSGDEVPSRAGSAERARPAEPTRPTGLDTAFAAAGPGQRAARDEWERGEPADVTAPLAADGLGWPAASPTTAPGTVTEAAGPGSARLDNAWMDGPARDAAAEAGATVSRETGADRSEGRAGARGEQPRPASWREGEMDMTEGRTGPGRTGPGRTGPGGAGLGDPAGPVVGTARAWPRASAPEVADFGATDLGRSEESDVVIPVVAEPVSDTPIARAARAALAARAGTPAWPRPQACRIITIANQKGGVGKTTTAVNLAASLSLHGSRVLVIDLDPQGNASTALDVDHHSGIVSIYNVLVDGQSLAGVVRPAAGIPHLYCAPATIDLAGAEIELVPLVARESRLIRALAGFDSSGLDYIFIDCPPSLGLLTVNALVAAPEVLIPIQCEYYALEGLEQLLRTVDLVRSHLNPGLTVTTILLTMFDARTRLASQVAEEVREHFGEIVLGSIIPRSVRVSEAPSYGQSVMTYDPGSSGAQAYLEAAREMAHRNAPRT
jgi:chromosome partitioning protein